MLWCIAVQETEVNKSESDKQEMDQDICLNCEALLEDIVDTCPACGSVICFCSNPSCGMALTDKTAHCPYCGEKNLEYVSTVDSGLAAEGEDAIPDLVDEQVATTPETLAKEIAATLSGMNFEDQQPVSMDGNEASWDGGMGQVLQQRNQNDALPVTGGNEILAQSFSGESLGVQTQGITTGGGGGSLCPLFLEYDASQSYRLESRGLIRFRLRTSTLANGSVVQFHFDSSSELGLKIPPAGELALEDLSPLETRELPVIRCTPSVAGSEAVSVILDVVDPQGLPSSRWQGTVTVKVEGKEEREINIHAGGDIVDLGGGSGGLSDLLKGIPGANAQGYFAEGSQWLPVTLYRDAKFSRRIEKLKEWQVVNPPQAQRGDDMQGAVETQWVHVDWQGKNKREVFVFQGNEIFLGRAGTSVGPDVHSGCFRVDSDSKHTTDTRRISGCHLRLRISNGIAWVSDQSSNGTWLNGNRLEKDKWTVLGRGDSLSLRKVVDFRVDFQGNEKELTAVLLTRTNLSETQTLALTTGTIAISRREGQDGDVLLADGEVAWLQPMEHGLGWMVLQGGAWEALGPGGIEVGVTHVKPVR